MIRLGFAGADITPEKPAELVGFHREDNLSRGVLKPLAAQVSVWEAGEKRPASSASRISPAGARAKRTE